MKSVVFPGCFCLLLLLVCAGTNLFGVCSVSSEGTASTQAWALQILVGPKHKLKVCPDVLWNQSWPVQVVFFWVLIQWGWISIVATRRGLWRVFSKSRDLAVKILSNLMSPLPLVLSCQAQSLWGKHWAFPSLWNPWEKPKGEKPSPFLSIFKYRGSFPMFMFSPHNNGSLLPARHCSPLSEAHTSVRALGVYNLSLPWHWTRSAQFLLLPVAQLPSPAASAVGPEAAESLHVAVGCSPQWDTHYQFRGDNAALLYGWQLYFFLKLNLVSVFFGASSGAAAWCWLQALWARESRDDWDNWPSVLGGS